MEKSNKSMRPESIRPPMPPRSEGASRSSGSVPAMRSGRPKGAGPEERRPAGARPAPSAGGRSPHPSGKGGTSGAGHPSQPRRMRLPFERRPKDFGSWAYEHRVGLCCMVIAYLAFGIVFVSAKIVINEQIVSDTIYIDLSQIEPPPPEEQLKQEQDEKTDFSDVKNRISDEAGREESVDRLTSSSSKALSQLEDNLEDEAAAVAGRIKASRDAFEKGRREEQEMIDRHKAQREAKPDESASGVKQKGKVLVSYWLPGRRDVSLVIPAYQCEGGGEVTIKITVNRNGNVISSGIKESSTSTPCINDTALQAARGSRFNVDGTASDRQEGTITYVFIPQ